MQPLLGGPRAGLDEELLRARLSLGSGARVRHGVDVLDSNDQPTDQRLPFTTGEVTWAYRAPDRVTGQTADTSAVRRRARLHVPGRHTVNLNASRLRLWTEWQLDTTTWARFHLGVFEVVNPGGIVDDGKVVASRPELAGKAYRWANTFLPNPMTLPASAAVVDWLKSDLLSRFGEKRTAIPSSARQLGQARTFEQGTSYLAVYNDMLEAIGYDHLTDNEDGLPAAQDLTTLASRAVEHTYGAGRGKVLTAGEVGPLLPTLPNVVRFSARQGPSLGNIEGNGIATRRNANTGPASIAERGREVELRVDVATDSQEVLEQVADADAQRYFAGGGLRWQGQVGLNPLHSDRDTVGLELPRLDLTGGAWNVTEWTYRMGPMRQQTDALMPITCERRVAL